MFVTCSFVTDSALRAMMTTMSPATAFTARERPRIAPEMRKYMRCLLMSGSLKHKVHADAVHVDLLVRGGIGCDPVRVIAGPSTRDLRLQRHAGFHVVA